MANPNAANIVRLEGALLLAVPQTLTTGFLGQPAASLLVKNDDATDSLTVTIAGQAMIVAAGEQRTFTGIEGNDVVSFANLSGASVSTPFRAVASTSLTPPSLIGPVSGPVVTASIADGAITEAKLQPASVEDVLNADRSFVAVLDLSAGLGIGATQAFGPTLPDNAIVTYAWWEVETNFAAAAGGTLALGVAVDAAAGIKAATIFSDATYQTPGNVAPGIPTGTAVTGFTTKTTAARRFLATAAVGAFTAGRLILHGNFVVGFD